jgi:hypothetical protein
MAMIIEKWYLTSLQSLMLIFFLLSYGYVAFKTTYKESRSSVPSDHKKVAKKLWIIIGLFFAINLVLALLIKRFKAFGVSAGTRGADWSIGVYYNFAEK